MNIIEKKQRQIEELAFFAQEMAKKIDDALVVAKSELERLLNELNGVEGKSKGAIAKEYARKVNAVISKINAITAGA